MNNEFLSDLVEKVLVNGYRGVAHKHEQSNFQKNIIDWVIDGDGNAVVNAVAGSGKSSTLEAVSQYFKYGSALFLAFNKHVVNELSERLRGVSVSTIHSLGMGALNYKFGRENVKLDSSKYRKKLREMIDVGGLDHLKKVQSGILKATDMSRLTLSPLTDKGIEYICDEYGIELEDDMEPAMILPTVRDLIYWGEEETKKGIIDFTDMIYAPVRLNISPRKYDWVLVDEAQDLNEAQRALVMSAVRPGGRMMFVGDRRQAIYGFAGASVTSMDEISKMTKAKEMPLSICYRCPKSHIALAKEIVPEIEPSPTAKDGVIEYVPEVDAVKAVKSGDLILCRLTAPLIDLCFNLIGNGIGAKIRGMDIGEKLAVIAEKISKIKGFKFAQFDHFADMYLEKKKISILKKNGDDLEDPAIKQQDDMVGAVSRILELCEAKSIKGLVEHIMNLFSDEKPAVWLSTVHRAKGLEADTVWILKEESMPLSKRIKKEWQMDQEWNLRYVALTRAKKELKFIISESKPKMKPKPKQPSIPFREIKKVVKEMNLSELDNHLKGYHTSGEERNG